MPIIEIKQIYPTTFSLPSDEGWFKTYHLTIDNSVTQRTLDIARRILKFVGGLSVGGTFIWSLTMGVLWIKARKRVRAMPKCFSLTTIAGLNASFSLGSALIDTQLIPKAKRPRMWSALAVEAALTSAAFLHLLPVARASGRLAFCIRCASQIASFINLGRIAVLLDEDILLDKGK